MAELTSFLKLSWAFVVFWQVLCCLESCIVLSMWVSNLAGSHFSFLHSLVPKIGFAKTVVRSLWHFWGIFNWLIPMFLLRICFPFPHTTELLNAEIRLETHWQQNGPTSIKYDPSSAPLTVFWDIAMLQINTVTPSGDWRCGRKRCSASWGDIPTATAQCWRQSSFWQL